MRQLKIVKSTTHRGESLDKYFKEINKYPLITPKEEVELAQRIKKGDVIALEKLAQANLRFVVSVAKQYQNQGLTLEDLINEGNIGLINACKKFDETYGFKFISYAVWWIRQSILQAIAEKSKMVRLPLNKIRDIQKIGKETSLFMNQNEREPTPEELGLIMDMDPDEITKNSNLVNRHISFDASLGGEEEGDTLLDLLSDNTALKTDDTLIKESFMYELKRVLDFLPEKSKYIIYKYYGLDGEKMSFKEIGEKLHLKYENVRKMHKDIINFLRRKKRWKIYLGNICLD